MASRKITESIRIQPSYQVKPKRGISTKYSITPCKSRPVLKDLHTNRISDHLSSKEKISYTKSFKNLHKTSNHEKKRFTTNLPSTSVTETSNLPFDISSYKRKSFSSLKPLDQGFDANHEILESYKQHIEQLEDNNAQLAARVHKLESIHTDSAPSCKLLVLQQEGVDLRAALVEAEALVRAERRLVAALHADNAQIKLELLSACQRCISIELSSTSKGVDESRITELIGSEAVRRRLPTKLRALQQELWGAADETVQQGQVRAEAVLSLQQRVRSLEQCVAGSEREWAEERAALELERELSEKERELDDSRVKEWVKATEQKMRECQRECRLSAGRCSELTSEAQQQLTRHLQERQALLGALAKYGGPERLRRELEMLDVSATCLAAAEEHVSDTCRARELKLLSLQLQRELTECQSLVVASERRGEAMQRELCILRQGREEALDTIKRERRVLSQHRVTSEQSRVKDEQRVKTELHAMHAQVEELRADLKRLVHMIYKLTVWQSDSAALDGAAPNPPAWVDRPRAVATLARQLQAGLEAARTRLAGGVGRRQAE